jgi:hypothetical protein
MKADAATEKAVLLALHRLAGCYAERDMGGLLALCAPDSDHVMYGTGADEKRIGLVEIKAQAERDWSQTENASLAFDWTQVSAAGKVAWVAADATFKVRAGGQDMAFPARLTAVLENRDNTWLFVQSHFSFPGGSQEAGEAFPQ